MEKKLSILLIVILMLSLVACSSENKVVSNENSEIVEGSIETKDTIIIGTSALWYELLTPFEADFEDEYGMKLEFILFDDYVMPNTALAEGTIEGTWHQHRPYLEGYNTSNGTDLVMHDNEVMIGDVRMFYSDKINSLDELKEGDIIAINDDFSNINLALTMLRDEGLIELEEGVEQYTQLNITSNPLNLEIVELGSSSQLMESLEDVTAVIVAGISVKNAGYNPKDNLGICSAEIFEQGAVGLSVRQEDINSDWGFKLKEFLRSEKIKEFIEKESSGALIYADDF